MSHGASLPLTAPRLVCGQRHRSISADILQALFNLLRSHFKTLRSPFDRLRANGSAPENRCFSVRAELVEARSWGLEMTSSRLRKNSFRPLKSSRTSRPQTTTDSLQDGQEGLQQGRSERRGEAYSVLYVEPLSDARTPLADFFSILLEAWGSTPFFATARSVCPFPKWDGYRRRRRSQSPMPLDLVLRDGDEQGGGLSDTDLPLSYEAHGHSSEIRLLWTTCLLWQVCV
jgi:hypothetical protein